MGSFLSLLIQLAESFIAQNASAIEGEVLTEIERLAGSLFNTVATVNKTGLPPAGVKATITVPASKS